MKLAKNFFYQDFLCRLRLLNRWVWEHEIWYTGGSSGKLVSANFWVGGSRDLGRRGPNMVKNGDFVQTKALELRGGES